MQINLEKGRQFVWTNARLLERAIFASRFDNGSSAQVLAALRAYQNPDGGFGQALEPDLRAPESHPLYVEFGLRVLYDCGLRDAALTWAVCDFLAPLSDLTLGVPTLLPSAAAYPHAGHWDQPGPYQPSMDRLTSLVGLALWQGIRHPWLEQASQACLAFITAGQLEDAHTIQNAFCLVEALGEQIGGQPVYEKLARDLAQANFFIADAPVRSYGLTPLNFAPTPRSFCHRLFTDEQIEGHLIDLAGQQEEDGGWPVRWGPPGEMALLEWRGYVTVWALSVLRAYGKI